MSGERVQQRVQNKEAGQSALETLRVLNLTFIEKNNCWQRLTGYLIFHQQRIRACEPQNNTPKCASSLYDI